MGLCAAASNPATPSSGGAQAKQEHASAQKHQNSQSLEISQYAAPILQEQAVRDNKISIQPEEERHWYSDPDWWVAVFTGFLVLVTGGLWIFTALMWRETRNTVVGGERQYALSNRAFVYLDGFNVELTTAADSKEVDIDYLPKEYKNRPELYITRFAVQPKWKNNGNSPTKGARIQVNWYGPGSPVIREYTYKAEPIPLFVAPHAVEPSEFIEIPNARVLVDSSFRPNEREPFLFIWGRGDYSDIFGKTHFTEWCYRIRFDNHANKGMRASFIQWGKHNRSDEEETRKKATFFAVF